MPADSSAFSAIWSDPVELVKFIGGIVAIVGGLTAIAVTFFTKLLPWWRVRRDRQSLIKRLGDIYPEGIIERSTRYYIEPFCQSLDPAGSEEPRLTYGARQNLFTAIDDALNHPTEYRYLILLADSGMGKSSFLLNYYARHLRRRRKFEMALVPLGIPDADKRIVEIQNKKSTVLFLDALDEDTLAIVDHAARLRDLLKLTVDFQRVLITCRTQFFPKEEEIPQETGIVKVGPRAAGEKAQYVFHKLYLSPFNDEQVQAYLKRRYPFGQRRQRNMAHDMVLKIPQLIARPMLLAHIDDLVRANRQVQYSFELYEEMVDAWLLREEGIVPGLKKENLCQFSERLAVDLYLTQKHRGGAYIPPRETRRFSQRMEHSTRRLATHQPVAVEP
jgi:predicted NACHT family NTPase